MTSNQKTPLKEKFLLVSFSLLLSFVLIEMLLQLFAFSTRAKRAESLPKLLNNEFRILALGESTTDKFFAVGENDISWPGQLERMLNREYKGIKFTVINKGLAATSSSLIVKNTPSYLETWKPHLVIAMMGMNDNIHLKYLHREGVLDKLIIPRLIYSAYLGLRHVPQKAEPTPEVSGEFYEIVKKEFSLKSKEIPARALEWISRHPDLDWFAYRELSGAYVHELYRINIDEHGKFDQRLAFMLASRAVEKNPQDNRAVTTLLLAGRGFKKAGVKSVLKALKAGLQPNDTVINLLFWTEYADDEELKAWMAEHGFTKGRGTQLDNLIQNYRTLARMVLPQAKLAVMSYPTTDIKIFKSFFADNVAYYGPSLSWNIYQKFEEPKILPEFEKVLFIDNRDFPNENREKYFTDTFVKTPRGSFGHTTAEGHRLIAEKVKITLRKLWETAPKNL